MAPQAIKLRLLKKLDLAAVVKTAQKHGGKAIPE